MSDPQSVTVKVNATNINGALPDDYVKDITHRYYTDENNNNNGIQITATKIHQHNQTTDVTEITKMTIGLGEVNNTSDADKPISNATQAALDDIESKIPEGTSSVNKLVNAQIMNAAIGQINNKIPAEASSTNKLADKEWVLENGGKVDDIRVNGVSKVVNKIVNLIVKDTLADDSNDLATISAIRAFVNSSIEASVADYLRTSNGDAFATRAALLQGPWYYGSTTKTPTRNDYAVVIADETHGGMSARYIYQNGWAFQYTFNMQFTQAQLNAMNSGITAAKLALIDADISNRVEKTNQSKKFYGTDANGNQTLYDLAESGVVLASNFIQILTKGEQPTEALQDGGIVFENIFEEV